MEMEMEVKDEMSVAGALLERMVAATGVLEQAAERLARVDLEASLGRVASREAELEQRLAEAEATIVALKAAGTSARKTAGAGVATLVAKQGEAMDAGVLDAALTSLSLEQRIAVKSQLMRAGLIG